MLLLLLVVMLLMMLLLLVMWMLLVMLRLVVMCLHVRILYPRPYERIVVFISIVVLRHHATADWPAGLVGHCRHAPKHRMVQMIVQRRRRVPHKWKGRITNTLV